MNSLSWFLYLASVLPSVSNVIFFFAILMILIVALTAFMFFISEGELNGFKMFNWVRTSVIAVILMVMSSFIPDKNTIYMIAGSEAGEAVVTSVEGQEILNDIKTIIKQQINPD